MREIASSTAKVAASEKLRTVMMETTVEVRHRLAAFRTAEVGAVSFDVRKGIPMGNRGNAPNTTKTTGEST
jgi:hypothetical protein